MAENYGVDFEANPSYYDGFRCLSVHTGATALPTAYRGRIGGAVLRELERRRTGNGSASTALIVTPNGFGLVAKHGTLPTLAKINDAAWYEVTVFDPSGSDAAPEPFLSAIAAAIAPPP